MKIKTEDIKNRLEQEGIQAVEIGEIKLYPSVTVAPEDLVNTAILFRDEFGFDQLRDIVGVDRFTRENRFECIYNLYSTKHLLRIFLVTRLDSKKPEVETLTKVWKSAEWAEREVYDMYGINFLNHPDLRRMYMMEEYEYYPLRKDYPLMGIPGAAHLPEKKDI